VTRRRPGPAQQQLAVGGGRNPNQFVMVQPNEMHGYCAELGLKPLDRTVLTQLILEADRHSGIVRGFSLVGFAERMGLGPSSGRRTVAQSLQRLEEAGAVKAVLVRGAPLGEVLVVGYGALVRPDKERSLPVDKPPVEQKFARQTRELEGKVRAPNARTSPKNARQTRELSPINSPLPGTTSAQEVLLEKTFHTLRDESPPGAFARAVEQGDGKEGISQQGSQLLTSLAEALGPRGHELWEPGSAGGLVKLRNCLEGLVTAGWTVEELLGQLSGHTEGAGSLVAVLLTRAKNLPAIPVRPADPAAAAASRRQQRLEAAESTGANRARIIEFSPEALDEQLRNDFSDPDELEAARQSAARCRERMGLVVG